MFAALKRLNIYQKEMLISISPGIMSFIPVTGFFFNAITLLLF